MPKRGSADVAFMLLGGRDILPALTQFDDSHEAITERSDTLGDAWEEHQFVGVKTAELTVEGFYDDDAGGFHEAMSTGLTTGKVLCYGLEGTSAGARFVGWESAQHVRYERMVQLGALTKARATFRTNGAVDEGLVLRSLAVATASGNTSATPVDHGASSTGWITYFQIASATDMASVTLRVLHSSDNVTFATLSSTTVTVAAMPHGGRNVATGVAERYTIADWSFNTASAGRTARFMHGLVRVTAAS